MKPVVWRIFRGGRWNYADKPSNRQEDRAAWQPLYTASEIKREWQRLTDNEIADMPVYSWGTTLELVRAIEARLKEKNNGGD